MRSLLTKSEVLVTGATGFLGRHLIKDLIDRGLQVSVLVRKSSDLSFIGDKPLKVFYGDVNDPSSLLAATRNKERVYHLAGLVAYKKEEHSLMEKVNVQGTAHILKACVSNRVSKFLHLSSVAAIGASFKPQPLDEDSRYNLEKYNLGYFETKKKAEELVVRAFHEKGLKTYLINPSTVYGAGDGTKNSRKTQGKVAKGRFIFYPPGGVNVVYVGDVIKAIDLCLKKGQPARRYIISGENMTIRKLFFTIAEIAGVKAPVIPLPKPLLKGLGFFGDFLGKFSIQSPLSGETALIASLYHWFSNKRAKEELGFHPTPARKALEESVFWMIENGGSINNQ